MVLFFLLVLFVFIRISGRHYAVHDQDGTPVDRAGEKFVWDVLLHVVTPWVSTPRGFALLLRFPHEPNRSFAGNSSSGPPTAAYVQLNAADVDVKVGSKWTINDRCCRQAFLSGPRARQAAGAAAPRAAKKTHPD